MNMEKKLYIAPQITSVSFRTERGYATSYNKLLDPEATNEIFLGLAEGQLSQEGAGNPMEEYEYRSGWYNPETDRGSFF